MNRKSGQSKTNARRAAAKEQRRRAEERHSRTHRPLEVVANYHQVAENRWTAELLIDLEVVRGYTGDSPEAVFTQAMGGVNEIADEQRRPIATMHMLDEDPAAWGELARDLGLEQQVDHHSMVGWLKVGD